MPLSFKSFLERFALYGILLLAILAFGFYHFFFEVPNNFHPDSTVRIEHGESLAGIANQLQHVGVIAHPRILTSLVVFLGGERKVTAGYYLFSKPENLFTIAYRLTHSQFDIVPVKITIPEGLSSKEITDLYSSKFNLFASSTFYELAKDKEGYLFPETYFFVPTILPEEVISRMQSAFYSEIADLDDEIAASPHSLNDIVTMASILEGEATDTVDRKIIAGILWKRLSLNIPLQVDASLKYLTGKTSAELTTKDLKIDSPFNTYVNRGLPPTPISNPGLDTIRAALEPTETDYLYFLSDKSGGIHYAKTLKEHDANIAKYLR